MWWGGGVGLVSPLAPAVGARSGAGRGARGPWVVRREPLTTGEDD